MDSVGEKLAAERRRQGKTLAEVEAATKVMGRMLDAIEHDRYAELPSPVYVKGYIQAYARFLGMDEGPLIEQYKHDAEVTDAVDRITVPHDAVVEHRDALHAVPFKTWLIALAAVLLVALALWGISALGGEDETPPPVPPETTGTPNTTGTPTPGVTTPTVPATSTVSSDEETGTSAGPVEGEPFELVVTVAEGSASWLEITVDGLEAYIGTLPGGETRSYTVNNAATVFIGRPQSVTITRDGENVPIPLGQGTSTVELSVGD